MKSCRLHPIFLRVRGFFLAVVALPAWAAGEAPLVWLPAQQVLRPPAGATVAEFTFTAENRSASAVEIRTVRPSCGCTTVELPALPWVIASGARGSFRAVVDFAGKHGRFSKEITVQSTAGVQLLGVTVELPEPAAEDRQRNQGIAAADRQAVFRGECASCHAAPLAGLTGRGLFATACGICHEAERRASMVPDLRVVREPRDESYWRRWISEGRAGTLMPAFAAAHGGPLTERQIEDLVAFALAELPREPRGP